VAVIEVLTFEVKPGRLDDFLADIRQLQSVLARVDVGLTGIRVLRSMIAGAESGRVMLMVENVDLASWGKSLDNEIADPEDQAISTRWDSPDSPVTLVNRMLLRDIAL
jgi:hypothetical protein